MDIRRAIAILLGAGTFAALLILGWGIRDFASFFVSWPRAAFLASMLIAVAGASASAQTALKKGTRTPSGQRLILASVQVVTLPLLFFLPYADKRGIFVMHAEWVRWLGLGSALAGYAIGIVALRALGKNYSAYVTIQEQHRLVQTGIYSVVRNPIYLGMVLSWPGACLVFRSWLVFPIFVYFLVFGVLRGAQEERVLREHFNAEFDAYRQRTWRLLPYVY
jgi:protein-S-isoprenylcysteine O-methyltransferase Ste14